ncbi:MAG TPA: bifunctional phosphoribosylaminoimidazolecarboxamide formyltransferase/IMP cyclohydrolase [Firmicutes bacterium]|nr:bifunctional phosphoribosylaminoimidazolecarboxamide formyltransferase/IMP cyclohydrolase [Bacillota bacterium]
MYERVIPVDRKKRAIVSVSDKSGIVDFAGGLSRLGVEIVATGGTEKALSSAGIPVVPVEKVTGFPEMLDGRVKTLHPAILGGILAIRSRPDHMRSLEALGAGPIDFVVVNLYPFEETIARPDADQACAIENIDIGGPTMIRAAAKNFEDVAVITSPRQYRAVLEELTANECSLSRETRLRLAYEAFLHVALYDAAIQQYFAGLIAGLCGAGKPPATVDGQALPEAMVLPLRKALDLRYGENPHQAAAFYSHGKCPAGSIPGLEKLRGKELSFNNIADASACYELVAEFDDPTCVIVKHMNPCGVASRGSIPDAYRAAYAADPVSSFGGIVGFNRPVDRDTAEEMAKTFLEVIIAPGFDEDAVKILEKKRNLRLLVSPLPGKSVQAAAKPAQAAGEPSQIEGKPAGGAALAAGYDLRRTIWGILAQELDPSGVDPGGYEVVAGSVAGDPQWRDLIFAWKVVKHVKSNAIVLAKDQTTLGIGAGQMNRVGAARIAIQQAGDAARGAVLASDGFLPMRDTVDVAADAGIAAIIQPGGSIRDRESIDACIEHGITMVFTHKRHFRH